MMRIYGVGEVGVYLQATLADDDLLADVWVTGEVTNLTRASSGHLYFTLRDDVGQLRAVMWRSYANRVAVRPQSGDAVVAHGKLDFYPPQGSLQVVVDLLYPAGVGEGQLRFEALRLKLEQEGLFAEERKRPLPPFPRRIGLVTSESGAVYHDVVTVLARRFPLAQLVFAHASVQGDRAPAEIVRAIRRLADWRDGDGSALDVVIVGRGGGSPEELACFNDERVARAIFAAPWPVVSAVGHETDVSLADFVADVRAPTPSAAAELVSPDLAALRLDLAELAGRASACVEQAVDGTAAEYRRARDRLLAHSPLGRIARERQAARDQVARARLAVQAQLRTLAEQLAGRSLQLAALSPRATLDRGYSIVTGADGTVIRTAAEVRPGDPLTIELGDGAIDAAAQAVRPTAPTESAARRRARSAGRPAGGGGGEQPDDDPPAPTAAPADGGP